MTLTSFLRIVCLAADFLRRHPPHDAHGHAVDSRTLAEFHGWVRQIPDDLFYTLAPRRD
jgi:hypothetical protein